MLILIKATYKSCFFIENYKKKESKWSLDRNDTEILWRTLNTLYAIMILSRLRDIDV